MRLRTWAVEALDGDTMMRMQAMKKRIVNLIILVVVLIEIAKCRRGEERAVLKTKILGRAVI